MGERERNSIIRENEALEKKLDVLHYMKDNKAGSTHDLFTKFNTELESLNADRKELDVKRASIEKKQTMIDELRKRNVETFDDLENSVRSGAERIGSKQADLKKKLIELAKQLEDSKFLQ